MELISKTAREQILAEAADQYRVFRQLGVKESVADGIATQYVEGAMLGEIAKNPWRTVIASWVNGFTSLFKRS